MTLIRMSLSGGCIIVLAALLRRAFLHRLPKQTFSALWMLAALRMLFPLEIQSRWSLFALLFPKTSAMTGERIAIPASAAGAEMLAKSVQPERDGLIVLWLIGMLVCASVFLMAWNRGMKRFRSAKPLDSEIAEGFLKAYPLRRKVCIRICESISTPLTYGILHPVILLPENMDEDARQIRLMLCHEWMHIRSFDALKKLLFIAVVCIHWFNPLAWLMLVLVNRDLELACDERVMQRYEDRRAYALTLIAMEERRLRCAPLVNHFAKNLTEERINAIMKMKKVSIVSVLLAVLLLASVTIVFATSAPEENVFDFAKYESFGLVYDAEESQLYFNEKRVRYFEDVHTDENGVEQVEFAFCNLDGEIDIVAVHEPSGGELTKIAVCTQEEFDARTEQIENEMEWPFAAEKSMIAFGKEGKIEYLQTWLPMEDENIEVSYRMETDGEDVSMIGGADGPTSIFVTSENGGYSASIGSVSLNDDGSVTYTFENKE